jgi:hypothetical protein
MLFRELTVAYYENNTKHKSTVCGQNEQFQYVKAGSAYTNTNH